MLPLCAVLIVGTAFVALKAAADTERSASTTHYRTVVDGQPWSMSSVREGAMRCLRQEVPGEPPFKTCPGPGGMFVNGRSLWALFGARQQSGRVRRKGWANAWVLGFAAKDVAAVELLDARCRRQRLPLDSDGAFFHVVSRQAIRLGRLPGALLARSSEGRILEVKPVSVGEPGTDARRRTQAVGGCL
jgi:hypothetical protein